VLVPMRDIPKMIASEKILHSLTIAAFSFFHVYNPPKQAWAAQARRKHKDPAGKRRPVPKVIK
jgi:hypothetical protein